MKEIRGKKFYVTLGGLGCLSWVTYLVSHDAALQIADKKDLLGNCIWALVLITTGFSGAQLYSDLKGQKKKEE